MVTLYGFGRFLGLADPSPFVVKTMITLQMAGVPYTVQRGDIRKAPRGKLPYIDDDGALISDSHLIRLHVARKYGFDFEAGLTAEGVATGWAAERLCEDHLYWFAVRDRWLDDENFANGVGRFFDSVPVPLRYLLRRFIRHKVRASVRNQGAGRFTEDECRVLVTADIQTLSALLGDKPFLLGDQPTGADATVFAFIDGILCKQISSHARTVTESLPNLVAYRDRMADRFPLPR